MTKRRKLPFVSIVVIAYNKEKGIELTLKSLLNQSYPKNRYEIIIVDDCSKDKTTEIVKKFPVRLIKHKINLGRAQARNTGLKYAKGEIYVSFDGDCIADRNWLKEIIKVYQIKENIGGVSGLIKVNDDSNLTESFINESGCGNPTIEDSKNKNSFLFKIVSYIKSNSFSVNILSKKRIFEINMMSGANSSFPKKILIEIGGYRTNLDAGEDTDIVNRIKDKEYSIKFYCNPNAIIIHNHRMNFLNYILRPWRRKNDMAKFFSNFYKIPLSFIFPVVFITLCLISIFINWKFLLCSMFLLPQLLYFGFPLRFIKCFKIKYLIFPYMRLIGEIISLFSIAVGYLENKK